MIPGASGNGKRTGTTQPIYDAAEEVPEAREHMGSYGLAMVRRVIIRLFCWRHNEIY